MNKSIVISLLSVIILFCTTSYSFASTGVVTTDTLRLRKEASTDATILELLSMDDEVEILEESNGWYKVKANVNSVVYTGYVSADYIKVIEETENQEEQNNTEEENEQNTENENVEMVKTLAEGTELYTTPTINALVLNKLNTEAQIQVVSEVNGWAYVTSGDIKGWVRTEKIVEKKASETEQNNSSQKTGYISGNSVNFRKEASTSGTVILRLKRNDQVKIISESDGWSKVEFAGNIGYVSSEYVSNKKITLTSRSSSSRTAKVSKKSTTKTTQTKNVEKEEPVVSKGTATGSEIVAYAKKYLGYKYVYGGSTPSGFDCSGFTSYVYKHFGYSLSRSSSAQASNGKAVSKSELQAGDIVCFARSSGSKKVGHVGIYIGGGRFIHAANSRKGVITSNISGDGFYFVCARRII